MYGICLWSFPPPHTQRFHELHTHIQTHTYLWMVIYNDEESHQADRGLTLVPGLIIVDSCLWFLSKIKTLKCFS